MKSTSDKRTLRERRVGTHDQQPSLFDLPITESDADLRFLHSKEGIREQLINELKKQKKLTNSFKTKRVRKHERKKVLQYGLRMRERTTDRVVDYAPKPACSRYDEARLKGNDVIFTDEEIIMVHQKLLLAFQQAFANNWASNSPRCIELVVWMTANRPEEPYSFETCCYLSDIDPDIIKSTILRQVKRRYKSERLHYDVFRQAIIDVERGNEDALKWFHSDDTSEFSFLGLCKLFEFEPSVAKASVRTGNVGLSKVA